MDKKNNCDVVIVGAGPAAAMCAKLLTKNSFDTVIIERKRLPRHKICAGLLSKAAQDNVTSFFDEIPKKVICKNRYLSIKISKKGYDFLDIPATSHLHVYRNEFDYWLIRQTQARVFDYCTYIKHRINANDSIEVYTHYNGKPMVFTCKYLIGADGGSSCVRKNTDCNFIPSEFMYVYQEIYMADSTVSKNHCYFLLGKLYSQKYSWFFYNDDSLHIGSVFYHKNRSIDYIDNLLHYLKTEFNLSIKRCIKKQATFHDPRTDGSRFNFGDANVLLIGEAAGLVTYLGEGIPAAFISGKIAAEVIINNRKDGQVIDIYKSKILNEMNIISADYTFWRR